ncbi:hypothetical protein [Candidatus Ferrigenium straubiae]|jgi:hypothetical protein|uniref:hypothetical protein n=1 Tax=Candidatus Ferrigenium straubiae TaxID=2919506 RepID=UPI003F4AF5BD
MASRDLINSNTLLIEVLRARPKSARIAVYLMVANIFILQAISGWHYLIGTIPLLQLNANLLVYSTLLFLPWRIWLAGGHSRVAYTLLISSSISWAVVPAFFGIVPDAFADRLMLFSIVIPVQLASLISLCLPATTAWFSMVEKARVQ